MKELAEDVDGASGDALKLVRHCLYRQRGTLVLDASVRVLKTRFSQPRESAGERIGKPIPTR